MASLLSIPLELLVEVSSFLSTPDLGALRLTCKQVEKSLYEWFSKEFFTKKQFMLTQKSLQAFIDISKHVSFSRKLTHVIIATNVYTIYSHLHFKDGEAAARYVQGYEDQKALLNTGVDREMLTEAFKNLENLQTVGIRDFNNNRRSRDGINWSSWGATTVHRETGVELQFAGNLPYVPHVVPDFLPRVFQNLIYALGKANQTPQEIEVLLRRHSLPDSAFNVSECILPTVRPFLGNLKKLLLNVDTIAETIRTHADGTLTELLPSRSLGRFLAHTPHLTHLRLNLQKAQFENNERLLRWLSLPASNLGSQATTTFFEPAPIDLANLTALELGQFQARPNVILDVIAKFAPTLRDLSLWRMTLSDGQHLSSYSAKPNLWAKFFANLANIPQLQLQSLKAGMLTQEWNHVQFKSPSSDDAPTLKVKEYSGNKMDAFLKELTEEVFVQWPEVELVDSDSEDEDEDMADEDDDNDDDGEENEGDDGTDDE
jgi:hypothetical protein